jgi:hypothetical protein
MMVTEYRVHLIGTDWESREIATSGAAAIAKAMRKIRIAEIRAGHGFSRVTADDFRALRVGQVLLRDPREVYGV